MSIITYNGCDDYGFLTCRSADARSSTIIHRSRNDLSNGISQASSEKQASKTKQDEKKESLKKSDKKSKAEQEVRKRRWWRSIFSSGSKKKEKRKLGESKATVARHKSDACSNRSVLRQKHVEGVGNLKSKHRSAYFAEDSVIIVDEQSLNEAKDPSLKVELNDFHERSKLRSAIRKSVSFSDVGPLHIHKSASMDCIESLRQQNQLSQMGISPRRCPDVKNTSQQPCVPLTPVSEDKNVTEISAKAQESKTKPAKPARNKLKMEQAKATCSSADNLLDERLESNPQAPVLRRSRSMLSFKNLFARKSKSDEKGKKRRAVSTNMEILLQADVDNISIATSKDEVDSRKMDEINVYERYPRRKSEQRKVLVHIQTKEEIPVENGVPQWDSSSYQYSCLSGRGIRNRKDETSSIKPKPKLVESSFVGTRQHSNQPQTNTEEKDAAKPPETSGHFAKPVKIMSLENEPKNLELDRRKRTRSDGILLDRTLSVETELLDAMKIGEDNPSRGNFHAKSSSCCEDLPFGRTFVLTGVATDKIPEVIARNYPYISTSSPVRNMAQCLRFATGIPKKKSSPTREKLLGDLSPSSDVPQHCNVEESAQEPETSTAPSSVVAPPDPKPKPSPIKQAGPSPFQPRRCFSDSDLSSIHLSPMKISDKYKSEDKVNTSRRVSRSRSARTDRLLHRMRTRILRLEKLSDLASNQQQYDHNEEIVNDSSLKPETLPTNDQNEKEIQTTNQVSTLENIKIKSDASSTTNSVTSSRKFHRLIKTRVQNRGDNPSYARVAGLQHMKKNLQERNKAQVKPEKCEPNYENLWPDENLPELDDKAQTETPSEQTEVKTVYTIQKDQKSNSLLDHDPLIHKSAFISTRVNSYQTEISTHDVIPHKVALKDQTASGSRAPLVENLPPQNDDDLDDVIGPHDIFLSSTPVKNYPIHAARANEKTKNLPTFNLNEAERASNHMTSGITEVEESRVDLSPNPSVIPSASDYFLRSLVQHQDEIKRTMLQEMQKISHKYSASATSDKVPTGAAPFGASRCSQDDEQSSESDSTSQGTVTWDKEHGSVSSGDTITNFCETEEDGYATMSSNDSTAAQCGSIISSLSSTPQSRHTPQQPNALKCPNPIEYVIPFRGSDVIEEASDFMEWDCDETDL